MKIFEMNDCEWWLANTAEEAITDMVSFYGGTPSGELSPDGPREITEAELDPLTYYDDLCALTGKRIAVTEA